MVCGFLTPDEGTICFGPEPGSTQDPRGQVGVCPQELVIWEQLTCLEQLVFMAEMYDVKSRAARARGVQLLEALHLADRAHQRAGTLSGGMKRRLNLLLALAHGPSVVLLDEPEAGLDPQSRVLVRDFIRGLARRTTVILTSHDMDEVDRIADRVGILHEGRMLVVDTPRNIKARTGAGDALRIEVEPCSEPTSAAALSALRALVETTSPGIGVETPGWRGARREHTRRYVTDEQRSQPGWIGAEDGEVVSTSALSPSRAKAQPKLGSMAVPSGKEPRPTGE
jgi:ABC-2 type transport system ATP-binding protein